MLSALPLLALVGAVEEAPSLGARLAAQSPALLASALLVLLSGFFSGSETALFSLQPVDRQGLTQPGRARVNALLSAPRRTLATILIGNELVNVTLGTVTASILLAIAPEQPWLNIVLLTPMLLIFGEVLPKVLALKNNRGFAALVSGPLGLFSKVVSPLRWLLTGLADRVLRATGGTAAPQKAQIREELLRELIDKGYEDGSLKPMEQEMLHKVFEFGDNSVGRLMTPRPDVFSLSLTTPWPELLLAVREAGFSRVPVWQGNPDNVIGILLVKNLLTALHRGRGDPAFRLTPRELKRCLISPSFVPTTKRAQQMLAEFRSERAHMAMVVDEHGSVVGVVTLDDLLAELVGDLLDETDVAEAEVAEVGAGIFTVKGAMDIDDFAERFRLELPAGEYTTVGGFVTTTAGAVPDKGDEIDWNGLRFVISGIEGRRVTEVSVSRIDLGPPLETEESGGAR